MSDTDDQTDGMDRALSQVQQQERAERHADIERQVKADEHLITALARKDETPDETT